MNLVEMFLPEMTAEFMALVPEQREYINTCMTAGSIRSYSLAADRSKLWIVFVTKTDAEMTQILKRFPIIDYVTYRVNPLMFHNSMEMMLPAISLN